MNILPEQEPDTHKGPSMTFINGKRYDGHSVVIQRIITLESQLTQLKADNAKLREGLEECLMAFQAEDLLLDEKRVQALLEQTKEK